MTRLQAGGARSSSPSVPTELALTQTPPSIVVSPKPDRADRQVIYDGLVAFETQAAGPTEILPLAILLKDDKDGTLGGLWGNTVFRWLVVELIYIPERFRHLGLGSQIMAQAEAVARQRGCIGIWLDTYSFQAPKFYEKHGFEAFGQVEDHPPGQSRIFMRKSLL